jgi:hypothetical protein
MGDSKPLICAQCGTNKHVRLEPSRTQYHWDGEGEDPNADVPLCPPCAEEHRAYWNERWEEYYGGLL